MITERIDPLMDEGIPPSIMTSLITTGAVFGGTVGANVSMDHFFLAALLASTSALFGSVVILNAKGKGIFATAFLVASLGVGAGVHEIFHDRNTESVQNEQKASTEINKSHEEKLAGFAAQAGLSLT